MAKPQSLSRMAAAIVLAVSMVLVACVHQPEQPPPQAQAPVDDDLDQADGVGGATALAVPVGRWLGAVILQMLQNVKLNVDVKLDNPQKDKP